MVLIQSGIYANGSAMAICLIMDISLNHWIEKLYQLKSNVNGSYNTKRSALIMFMDSMAPLWFMEHTTYYTQ